MPGGNPMPYTKTNFLTQIALAAWTFYVLFLN